MNKKTKILILGSLLLNVLLAGVIIGDWAHRFRKAPFIARHEQLTSKLSEDKAALFMKTLEAVHLDNRDVRRRIGESRKRAMKILASPEFDEAAYRAELENLHRLRSLARQQLANATIELAKQFDPKERRALAEHLRRPPRSPREDVSSRRPEKP